jgi:DNA-binding LytR/AlgR family response regulator
MAIETLIVDDEPAARSRLRKLLATFGQLNIVGEARDGVEALDLIVKLQPALVFLDVQMPGLDGFEVLRSLPATTKWPLVIFATAFDQYALAAFDSSAVGYLLKPINRDKLATAVERATALLAHPPSRAEERSRVEDLQKLGRGLLRHVVARTRDRFVLIPLNEAHFFRVDDGVVKVKTQTEILRTDYNIGDLEARLPNPPFFRAHRSVVVNASMIAEISPMTKGSFLLTMKDQQRTEVQVSERQSKTVRELLDR